MRSKYEIKEDSRRRTLHHHAAVRRCEGGGIAMVNPARPTDEDAERAKGRVALWLDGVAIAKSATAQSDTSEVQRDRVLENERGMLGISCPPRRSHNSGSTSRAIIPRPRRISAAISSATCA